MSTEIEKRYDLGVKSRPAEVSFNYEEVKGQLTSDVERYDVVVTSDTIQDSRNMRAELNATAKAIDDVRKEKVNLLTKNIEPFVDQMKELRGICKDGADKLDVQIKTFEEKRQRLADELLAKELERQIDEQGVRPEYRTAEAGGIAQSSALTAKDNLTKSARETIAGRVLADLSRQSRADARASDFEAMCYRQGLKDPLSVEVVRPYLDAPEQEYKRQVEAIIRNELERQKRAEHRVARETEQRLERERAERQRQEEQTRQVERQEKEEAGAAPEAASNPAPAPEPAPDESKASAGAPKGNRAKWSVTVTFGINAGPAATREQVIDRVRTVLDERGFKDVKHIEAVCNGS